MSTENTPQGWRYYKNSLVPNTYPHEEADTSIFKNGKAWKNKNVFLVQWTSDFDYGEPTSWWYTIKDDVFDLAQLSAKRRYEVRKGIKNFDVLRIDPEEYLTDLYRVYVAAAQSYPKKYRQIKSIEVFEKSIHHLRKTPDHPEFIYAAFFRETGELCAYSHVPVHPGWAALSALRADPAYEKFASNAALIYGILMDLQDRMVEGFYICDGSRNILHETNFQSYLEKYFMFRKAYCHLNIEYRPIIKPLIALLYPLRNILKKFDNNALIHKINGVLTMEEYRRS